jgi:predicted metal-binding membrane protein
MLSSQQEPGEGLGDLGLGRDRGALLTGGLLIAIAVLAWIAVIRQAGGMQGANPTDPSAGLPMIAEGGRPVFAGAAGFLSSWVVMMAAMMLPSATPMMVLYHAVQRNFSRTGEKGVPASVFALVYLALWLAFGAPVWAAGVLVELTARNHPALSGLLPYALVLILIAAGAYQFSRWKRVCLRVCQYPLSFLIGHWRSGYLGTLKVAFEHAANCIGCCGVLMIVLVAAGAMALHWVLLIAAAVFAEKIFPLGEWTSRIVGVALIALGILVAVHPALAVSLRGGM